MLIGADEKARELYEYREKARRDADMFLRWELKKQAIEFAKALLKMGDPIDKIVMATGLTYEEAAELQIAEDNCN